MFAHCVEATRDGNSLSFVKTRVLSFDTGSSIKITWSVRTYADDLLPGSFSTDLVSFLTRSDSLDFVGMKAEFFFKLKVSCYFLSFGASSSF